MAGYVEYLGASDLILEYPDTECATADLTGAVNVASYKIGQMVDRLQVNYQRASWSGDHDACTLYLLGRVARVLTLNGDQVSLAS